CLRYKAKSAPAEGRCDVRQNRFDDMRIVGHAQLVGDSQEQSVGLRDCLVLPKLSNEDVWLSGIATTKDRPGLLVDKADLVTFVASAPKVGAIAIIDQGKDAPADRDTWL